MIKIAYLGKRNETNGLIQETLENTFECDIRFYEPEIILNGNDTLSNLQSDLLILDLNTSSGFGSAPEKIQKISSILNEIPLLVLHIYEKPKLTRPILDAGANGFLSITPKEMELKEAVEALLRGEEFEGSLN